MTMNPTGTIWTVTNPSDPGRSTPGEGPPSWERTPDPDHSSYTSTARPRLGNDDRAASTSTQQDAGTEDGTASLVERVSASLAKIHETTTVALDASTPHFKLFAETWREIATERRNKRTPQSAERLSNAVKGLNKARRDEKTARAQLAAARENSGFFGSLSVRRSVSAARSARRAAAKEAREARREFPELLHKVVARVHVAHTAATGLASLALHSPWPVPGSATAAAAMYGALWLGSRDLPPEHGTGDLVPNAEEVALMERLDPAHWAAHCEARGLKDTLTTPPRLTPSGLQVKVRLDGTWTPDKLRAAEQQVRALLRMREATRLEVRPGKTGGWARLTLRTRTAADGVDLNWTPDKVGVGVDTVTGAPVVLPVAEGRLVAGARGSGKSVLLRPDLARLVIDPLSALVMVDMKRIEGALWRHCARVAVMPDEIEAVAAELVAEMYERTALLEESGRATWTPTPERPRIILLVDEGAEVLASVKGAMPNLSTLARLGRALGRVLRRAGRSVRGDAD
ncbi:FtsK/SpoIIIE domain-containing protein [Streptomyces sp. TRM68367]|uniref:FtsK/SpoIIIE domain-containing protein n=1 Tax=Streptomyces sp. TRM68367 TaxID=2758415 RepID=UPI00165AA98D|nr:FtsK/SpoIIIE domain-containing protein [Streptomyces sp. TRM68367]MBC9728077.1 hypothetical protein [Streptomyces sp. TRM68367]